LNVAVVVDNQQLSIESLPKSGFSGNSLVRLETDG